MFIFKQKNLENVEFRIVQKKKMLFGASCGKKHVFYKSDISRHFKRVKMTTNLFITNLLFNLFLKLNNK